MTTRNLTEETIDILRKNPGSTANELSAASNGRLSALAISVRLSRLETYGRAFRAASKKRCGISGQVATAWCPTPIGVTYTVGLLFDGREIVRMSVTRQNENKTADFLGYWTRRPQRIVSDASDREIVKLTEKQAYTLVKSIAPVNGLVASPTATEWEIRVVCDEVPERTA